MNKYKVTLSYSFVTIGETEEEMMNSFIDMIYDEMRIIKTNPDRTKVKLIKENLTDEEIEKYEDSNEFH